MFTLVKHIAGGNRLLLRTSGNLICNVQKSDYTGVSNFQRFSTKPADSSSESMVPVQFNILNDVGILNLEQRKLTNLGSGYGRLADYTVQTKDGKVLFVVEHFYGPSSPFFYINIKNKLEDSRPILLMNLIRDIHHKIHGMTYFVPPNKIIGTLEPFDIENVKNRFQLKTASGEVYAELMGNAEHGLATKVRFFNLKSQYKIMSPDGKRILGKLTKTKQQIIRSRLDAELHYPVTMDLLVKVQLIGAAIYLMGHHGEPL